MFKRYKMTPESRIPGDFHAIELLASKEHHMSDYVVAQQEAASRTNAPLDAIRMEPTGNWLLVSMLEPTHPFRIEYEGLYGPVTSQEGELQASL